MTLYKMKNSIKRIICICTLCLSTSALVAQYANTRVKTIHEQYVDSLKQVEYDYIFPIWGQQAYKKGFDIPYPVGIMGNYMWMRQNLIFDNMQLGIKTDNVDIPLTDVDFIEFGENINTSWAANVRPDVWVLPFLNVYGIFGGGRSNTDVQLTFPIELNSVVDQTLSTAGFGVLAAGGVGPMWFSVDANWTWSKPQLLDKPVRVNVLGIRLGHTFTFDHKPERNIAIWGGAMRMKMNSETSGEILLIDALPPEAWERKDEIVNNYWEWYENEATPPQKVVADKILTPIVERIDNADGDTLIRYGMDKQVKEMWNGTIGVQYQFNKRWMLRSEGGIIGNRKSILFSLNYRFLI